MFPVDSDAAIRSTDSDAAIAKLSAVQRGYLDDPFIRFLVPRPNFQPPRPPLINIGTFIRTVALDDLINQWIGLSSEPCQILSFGAGSDTRFWRLSTGPLKSRIFRYIELDFPSVTTKKAMAIRKSKELSAILGETRLGNGGTSLHSSIYHLLPADLRTPPSSCLAPLITPLLSSTVPTLLLFECVLVYMSPSSSSAIIEWFRDYFSSNGTILGGIVYEMFGLGDAFGRVMVENLKARNVSLPGAEPYPDLDSLPTRFLNLGFSKSWACTLRDIRTKFIDHAELERISKLEMLDETEELDLVLEHYAITWALLIGENKADEWKEWGFKAQPIDVEEE